MVLSLRASVMAEGTQHFELEEVIQRNRWLGIPIPEKLLYGEVARTEEFQQAMRCNRMWGIPIPAKFEEVRKNRMLAISIHKKSIEAQTDREEPILDVVPQATISENQETGKSFKDRDADVKTMETRDGQMTEHVENKHKELHHSHGCKGEREKELTFINQDSKILNRQAPKIVVEGETISEKRINFQETKHEHFLLVENGFSIFLIKIVDQRSSNFKKPKSKKMVQVNMFDRKLLMPSPATPPPPPEPPDSSHSTSMVLFGHKNRWTIPLHDQMRNPDNGQTVPDILVQRWRKGTLLGTPLSTISPPEPPDLAIAAKSYRNLGRSRGEKNILIFDPGGLKFLGFDNGAEAPFNLDAFEPQGDSHPELRAKIIVQTLLDFKTLLDFQETDNKDEASYNLSFKGVEKTLQVVRMRITKLIQTDDVVSANNGGSVTASIGQPEPIMVREDAVSVQLELEKKNHESVFNLSIAIMDITTFSFSRQHENDLCTSSAILIMDVDSSLHVATSNDSTICQSSHVPSDFSDGYPSLNCYQGTYDRPFVAALDVVGASNWHKAQNIVAKEDSHLLIQFMLWAFLQVAEHYHTLANFKALNGDTIRTIGTKSYFNMFSTCVILMIAVIATMEAMTKVQNLKMKEFWKAGNGRIKRFAIEPLEEVHIVMFILLFPLPATEPLVGKL